MSFATLNADIRTPDGKGAAKRLRRTGRIPAIAYGSGLAATALSVDPNGLAKALQGPAGLNAVLSLKVAGSTTDMIVMVREVTHHPVTRNLLHADFILAPLDVHVDVDVPLVLVGKAAGIAQGGLLRQIYRKLPIKALPGQIPVNVTLDITQLGLGQSIKASDLPLPEGVRPRMSAEQSVVTIVAPERDLVAEAEAAAAALKGAAPAKGAKGGAAKAAPAAAAAAAKPAAKKK